MKYFVRCSLAVGVAVAMFVFVQPRPQPGERPRWAEHFISKKNIPKAPSSISSGEDPIARDRYEWLRLRDPASGQVPSGIRAKELGFARKHPTTSELLRKGAGSAQAAYAWALRGPTNVGGRTRALAVDVADPFYLLAGGVSGGMWQSENGGLSWLKVPAADGMVSTTCVVQDRRIGKRNRWYYGTGELRGNSAAGGGGSLFRGDGIYRSSDNGFTWTKLPSTSTNNVLFDQPFDYVWNIALSPTDLVRDIVVAATIGTIQSSTDGGQTWPSALGTVINNVGPRYTDVTVSGSGVFYATCSSRDMNLNPNAQDRGIWRSTDGIAWTNITPTGWASDYYRTVVAIAPSNENIVYFLAETPGLPTSTNGHSLWKYTYLTGNGAGSGGAWEDRSLNLPNESGLSGNAQFDSQQSYDLVAAVYPTDPNILFIGGVNLYRSNNAFATSGSFIRIGGYSAPNTYSRYQNNHPDHHVLVFDPVNPLILYNGNDGGVFKTTNALSGTVFWTPLNNGYYTTQFYSVAIDPGTASNVTVIGGMQDNGTWIAYTPSVSTPWNEVAGGDGGFCAIASGGTSAYVSFQNGTTYRLTDESSGRIDPTGGSGYLFISPYALDPVDNNIMYFAAGLSVWRNSNLSAIPLGSSSTTSVNWTNLTNTSGSGGAITALASSARPLNFLYYGTSNGRVFRMSDANVGNPTPTDISTGKGLPANTYVTSIAIDPLLADNVLIAFSNYSVPSLFFTTDGGGSWQDVSGNLEEFPNGTGNGPSVRWVAMLPDTGKYHFLAATSTGLYATREFAGTSTTWVRESGIGTAVVDMIAVRTSDGYVAVGTHGNGVYSATIPVTPPTPPVIPNIPSTFAISQNYPNPFNGETKFDVVIPRDADITLDIYDMTGRIIATLLKERRRTGEEVTATWDGRSGNGTPVASGLYIYVLKAEGQIIAGKLMLVR